MDRWVNKIAIVTGASSGIGRAIAELLVSNGLRVVGIDLNVDKIKILAEEWKSKSGKLIPLQCDLANESEIVRSLEWIEKNLGVVEILVNNAVVNIPARLVETSIEDWNRVWNVNVLAPVVLIQGVLKLLQKKGLNTGAIININDICAWNTAKCDRSQQQISTSYLATKSALRALSDNLRSELAQIQSNVKVINIVLGLVETESTEQLLRSKGQLNSALKPKDVADAVVLAIQTPDDVLIQDLVISTIRDVVV